AERHVPGHALEIVVPADAQLRKREAVRRGDGGAELGALGADAPLVGRRTLDAADARHLRRRAFEAQPAADAAVRADRLSQLGDAGPTVHGRGAHHGRGTACGCSGENARTNPREESWLESAEGEVSAAVGGGKRCTKASRAKSGAGSRCDFTACGGVRCVKG